MDLEKRESLRLLTGIENGTLTVADAHNVAEQRDPVIVHFVLKYLREKYPAKDPSSMGVTQRLLELTSTYDSVIKAAKKGEKDSITEWFEDTYTIREFFDRPADLVGMLIDKIEG